MATTPTAAVRALYGQFFESGVRHFLPSCRIGVFGAANPNPPELALNPQPDGKLGVQWRSQEYAVHYDNRSLSEDEVRLVAAVSNVLEARYRSLFYADSNPTSFGLFRGLPEDHYVSAFLDPAPYLDSSAAPLDQDRVAEAIALLRLTSLTTYENRRVSTGALLLGSGALPEPAGTVPYSSELAAIKSFHRLSDGLKTVFVVNPDGMLVDLVDLAEFALEAGCCDLPAPSADLYRAHALVTLKGGHICLALTPNGEIKIWAQGAQQFSFIEGRWRLTEAAERYRQWELAIGERKLAELLFRVALNLAEARRGAMFVVVEEPEIARQFVPGADLLFNGGPAHGKKDRIQYLLRGKRLLDMEPTILETISRMDGAIVIDCESRLLAFGAILRHDLTTTPEAELVEGSRTTAAVESSRFGCVLKISEDGLVSFYQNRVRVWEI